MKRREAKERLKGITHIMLVPGLCNTFDEYFKSALAIAPIKPKIKGGKRSKREIRVEVPKVREHPVMRDGTVGMIALVNLRKKEILGLTRCSGSSVSCGDTVSTSGFTIMANY